jgi:hypothetical protein
VRSAGIEVRLQMCTIDEPTTGWPMKLNLRSLLLSRFETMLYKMAYSDLVQLRWL